MLNKELLFVTLPKLANLQNSACRVLFSQIGFSCKFYVDFARTFIKDLEVFFFIIWPCLKRTGSNQIEEFDWLKSILTAV